MARPKPDKQALLDAMAAHVLAHGLNAASLRPLAAAAGTSDRMLIYHFGSKDALVGALIDHLAARMAAGLEAMLPPEPAASEAALVGTLAGLLRSDAFAPYMNVWLDIVSGAAQGAQAHRAAGARIVDVYLAWLAPRLPEGSREPGAVLATIEGLFVLDAVGRSDVADAAIAALPS